MMDLDEFRDRLDALGADPTAWPSAERAAAEALLAASADARQALAAARRLDARLFKAMGDTAASTALRGRIAAIAPAQARTAVPPAGRAGWLALPWRIGMAAAAASLVLGLAVGRSNLIPLEESEPTYDLAALSYDAATIPELVP